MSSRDKQITYIDQTRTLLRKHGLMVPVEEVPTGNRDKDDRILGLEDYFERAMVALIDADKAALEAKGR